MYTKSVDQFSILHGDRVKLMHLVRMRLKECGWDEEVKLLCRKAVMEDGNENVDSVVQRVTPTARTLIPDVVKEELLVKIKILLQEQKRKETHRKKDEFKKREDMKKKEDPKKMSK